MQTRRPYGLRTYLNHLMYQGARAPFFTNSPQLQVGATEVSPKSDLELLHHGGGVNPAGEGISLKY